MRYIKYIIPTLLLMLCVRWVTAQQLPQYTQYMMNDFSLNPSIAGTQPYFEAKNDDRYQWIGITDAPQTYMLTFDGPLTEKHIGIGAYLYSDITGPTRRTGFTASYSYHMKLNSWLNASLGLSTGIQQFAVDGSQIILAEPGDPALTNNLESVFVPDIGFGFYLYGDNFYFGASVPQIIESHLQLTSFSDAESQLATHYYATAGYKYAVNSRFTLQPTFVFQYVNPAPPIFDIGLRAIYLDKAWLGAGYRTGDAAYALVGYTYQENLTFGYSYDYPVTDLRKYTFGTNEIFIGIRFNRTTTAPAPDKSAKQQ